MTLVIGKDYVILAKFPDMQNFRKLASWQNTNVDGEPNIDVLLCTRNADAKVYPASNVADAERFYHELAELNRLFPYATWSYREFKEAR